MNIIYVLTKLEKGNIGFCEPYNVISKLSSFFSEVYSYFLKSFVRENKKKEKFKIYEIIVVFLPYIPSLHPNLAKYGILLSPENRSFPQMFFSACF